jgi:hypothetical protein
MKKGTKMKKSAVLSVLILGLLGALAAIPASAGSVVLYDNSTASSYVTNNWYNYNGYYYNSISDSFTLSSPATVTGVTFGSWTDPGATVTDLQWAIGTTDFASDIASGSASITNTGFIGSEYGFDVDSNLFSLPDLSFGAGTYWLTLSNVTASDSGDGGIEAWDQSNGPSSADDINYPYNPIPSETFSILGNTSSVTPEPSSFLLLGSGLAGLAGLLKRKFRA